MERSRVVAAGHHVEDGRVDGVIAISRAIGDWEYKSATLEPEKMAVSAFPDISKTLITKDTEFIICACDGIWDCMTSQQACDFVAKSKAKLKDYNSDQKNNQSETTAAKVTSSNKKTESNKQGGATPGKKTSTKPNNKLDATIDNSKFRGLATVVEMIMENNCPASLG